MSFKSQLLGALREHSLLIQAVPLCAISSVIWMSTVYLTWLSCTLIFGHMTSSVTLMSHPLYFCVCYEPCLLSDNKLCGFLISSACLYFSWPSRELPIVMTPISSITLLLRAMGVFIKRAVGQIWAHLPVSRSTKENVSCLMYLETS